MKAGKVEEAQPALLCGCGGPLFRAGMCVPCLRRFRLSRERFGGNREQVLHRDRFCRGCGTVLGLLVHHRRRGKDPKWMSTLCRRCHPRVHHTRYPRFGFPITLLGLWRELHPGVPEQRELPLVLEGAPPDPPREQVELF